MIHKSSRFSWSFALLAAGCFASSPVETQTPGQLEEQENRPPGVVHDPVSPPPAPEDKSHSEQGLMTLRAPPNPQVARGIVRQFFAAVLEGSWEKMSELVRDKAWVSTGSLGGRRQINSFWQSRLAQLDYPSLAGQLLYRESEIETYSAEDMGNLDPPRQLPLSVGGSQVLVVVPMAAAKQGRVRMFGDEIAFLLEPKGNSFEIVEMQEEFQLR